MPQAPSTNGASCVSENCHISTDDDADFNSDTDSGTFTGDVTTDFIPKYDIKLPAMHPKGSKKFYACQAQACELHERLAHASGNRMRACCESNPSGEYELGIERYLPECRPCITASLQHRANLW